MLLTPLLGLAGYNGFIDHYQVPNRLVATNKGKGFIQSMQIPIRIAMLQKKTRFGRLWVPFRVPAKDFSHKMSAKMYLYDHLTGELYTL